MSSARSMTWASMDFRIPGTPSRNQRKAGRSSAYTPNFLERFPLGLSGASSRTHGYLHAASRAARVRFSPAEEPSGKDFLCSSRASRRRVWALPSKPPAASATASSAFSPLCPNGGWPRSWDRHAVSTRSGSQPRDRPSSRPICATSSEWVRRVREKSSTSGATT